MPRKRNYVRRVRRRVRAPSRKQVKSGGLAVGRLFKRSAKDAVALSLARKLIPNIAGANQGSLDKVSAGIGLRLMGQGGTSMIEVAGAEFGANILDSKIMPLAFGAIQPKVATATQTAQGTYSTIQALYQQ